MREYQVTDAPVCMGCGQEIHHEPMMHESALNIVFVAHDFTCMMNAYQRELRALIRRRPQAVEQWLEATGHNTYPQHESLMQGAHE